MRPGCDLLHGATLLPGGGVRFRLWAPAHARVALALEDDGRSVTMLRSEDGWHALDVAAAGSGTRYRFILPDGQRVPDPASRFQPQDVHGASEVIDPAAYAWRDGDWRGRPWHEAVLYELHVGAFTPKARFAPRSSSSTIWRRSALPRSSSCRSRIFPAGATGATTACCSFAPDSTYGRPEDLKALVDAAHARGLMVLLDVVYNHFGPDGNYLPAYAPHSSTQTARRRGAPASTTTARTARGARVRHPERALLARANSTSTACASMPCTPSSTTVREHILEELAERVRATADGRRVHLVLENEDNRAHWLARDARWRAAALHRAVER